MLAGVRVWAASLKRNILTVYFAARDPRTPIAARVVAFLAASYALSPIDLIPDFIPILGYLDDLLIVPLALALALRMLPSTVLADARAKAAAHNEHPTSYTAAIVVLVLWFGLGLAALYGYVAG